MLKPMAYDSTKTSVVLKKRRLGSLPADRTRTKRGHDGTKRKGSERSLSENCSLACIVSDGKQKERKRAKVNLSTNDKPATNSKVLAKSKTTPRNFDPLCVGHHNIPTIENLVANTQLILEQSNLGSRDIGYWLN